VTQFVSVLQTLAGILKEDRLESEIIERLDKLEGLG
jgi:hypothetical protein